jgi:CTP:molybdopterin cytidylyltransferase MocA
VVWIAGAAAPDFVDCKLVTNPDAEAGLGTSVACAARIASERGAERMLVMLADMPLVSPALLEDLLAAKAPAACGHGGRPGVPAIFPASMFDQLQALTGDAGAGAVLRNRADLVLIPASAEELLDVDTPAALADAERLLRAR